MPLIDLEQIKAEMMKQLYPCGLYQYQLSIVGTHSQPKMVWSPLIATWWVYHLLQAVTYKNTTACSQNIVAWLYDFEMLLTKGLYLY